MSTKIRKTVSGNEKMFMVALVAVILVAIITATICIVPGKKKTDGPTTEPTTTAESVTYQGFHEIYTDRDTEHEPLVVRFHGANVDESCVNIRTDPDRTAKYLFSIDIGESYYADRVYESEDSNWYGFETKDLPLGLEMLVDTDSDGIIWASKGFTSVSLCDWDAGEADKEDYEVNVGYTGNLYFYVNETCHLRSTPTRKALNEYGQLKEGTYVSTNTIYIDNNYLWYGIKAADIPESGIVNQIGSLETDPDGIVWIYQDCCSETVWRNA